MAPSNIQSAKLVACLLSEEVQVPLPVESNEVLAHLAPAEVSKVFTDHVPGVERFLFRQQPGQCVLKFIQIAYKDGWSAFKGTVLEDHLKWLMRLIVHYGHEGKPDAKQYLREVAEAFMDCQAVQGRVVERIGLQIQGVTSDFKGLVVALVGEYKTMALKMLAAERIAQGKAYDDATPTHYENRLTADLGQQVGLNADDVRRANLDEHARARFPKLRAHEVEAATARYQELFDLDAFVQVLVSELNSFSASSCPNGLARLFLAWASENMVEKHVVFDEETCSRIDVDRTLAMAVLEVVFLGQLDGLTSETFHGRALSDLFERPQVDKVEGHLTSSSTCNAAEVEAVLTNDDVLIEVEQHDGKCTSPNACDAPEDRIMLALGEMLVEAGLLEGNRTSPGACDVREEHAVVSLRRPEYQKCRQARQNKQTDTSRTPCNATDLASAYTDATFAKPSAKKRRRAKGTTFRNEKPWR